MALGATGGRIMMIRKSTLNVEQFSVETAYSKGDVVTYDSELYSALDDIVAGDWDATKWLKLNLSN